MYGREAENQFDEGVKDRSLLSFDKDKTLKDKWNQTKHIIWSPEIPDNMVLGSSLLWYSEAGKTQSAFPETPWAMDVAKNLQATAGEWYWEYISDSLHQVDNAEAIRDHLFRAIYGSFYNAKQKSGNAYRQLAWMSYLLGKRESRRLTGDHIFTFANVRDKTQFADAVVVGERSVDVHHPQILTDPVQPDFLSDAVYYKATYAVPYRCFYSKNIKNLFMAGRNFSCSHLGLGGPRVMNTTAQMGCVVGYAASLCKLNEVLPRDIYTSYLDALKTVLKGSNSGMTSTANANEQKHDIKTTGKTIVVDNLKKELQIYNLTGQKIYENLSASGSLSFTFKQDGVYFVNADGNNHKLLIK
jgi:hypothetical protein